MTTTVSLTITVEHDPDVPLADIVQCLTEGIVHKHDEWILRDESRLDVISAEQRAPDQEIERLKADNDKLRGEADRLAETNSQLSSQVARTRAGS